MTVFSDVLLMSNTTDKVFKKFKRGTTKQREQMIRILDNQLKDLQILLKSMREFDDRC